MAGGFVKLNLRQWLLVPLLLAVLSSVQADVDTAEFEPLLQQLPGASLRKTKPILVQLEAQAGAVMLPLFESLLAGELYYRRDNKHLVRASKNSEGDYSLSSVFSGTSEGSVSSKKIKKIRVNNSLRTYLRGAIARINLNADEPKQRLAAIKSLLGEVDDDLAVLLQVRQDIESDRRVQAVLTEALALYTLQYSDDSQTRIQAIQKLGGNVEPMVRNELNQLVEQDEDGDYFEADEAVRQAAKDALVAIQSRLKFYGFMEQLFFGLSMGSVFLLAALGLAITFGVMGVINMAHGEMMMIGAYTAYVIQLLMPNYIGASILVAIPAAFIVAGLVGVLIERGVIQFLQGRPLETLLATFGISLILQQAVRSIFSPLNRQVITPEWMSGSLELNAVLSITYNRLYILIFALLVFAVVQLVMKYTSLGLNVRAVSQNRSMAKAIGIKTERVDALTFGLGSGIAGVAGVALSQLTNVGPNLGQAYIIDSFMVVVFGGVGNLLGTLVGGFTLGIANKFLEPATGAVLAKIIILVFIILFIQKRPKGLFPQKGRAAND